MNESAMKKLEEACMVRSSGCALDRLMDQMNTMTPEATALFDRMNEDLISLGQPPNSWTRFHDLKLAAEHVGFTEQEAEGIMDGWDSTKEFMVLSEEERANMKWPSGIYRRKYVGFEGGYSQNTKDLGMWKPGDKQHEDYVAGRALGSELAKKYAFSASRLAFMDKS